MERITSLALVSLALVSCQSIQGPAQVDSGLVVANQYVFRGVPQVDATVLQGDASVSFEDGSGGTYSGYVWANMNTSGDSGDAAFTDGHGNKVTEFDIVADYGREIGRWAIHMGFVNYNFPQVGRESTSEVYAAASTPVGPVDASFALFYDLEEIEGLYGNAAVGYGVPLADDVVLDLGLALGFMDADQGMGYVGVDESGLADLVTSASVVYPLTSRTSITATTAYSTMVSSDFSDALELLGIEPDNFIGSLGITWSN